NGLDAQFFRQKDRFPAGFGMEFRQRLVGVQRIAVTAQAADGYSLVLELVLWLARVITGAQLQGLNPEWLHFLDHIIKTQFGQQCSKESPLHVVSPPSLVSGRQYAISGRSPRFFPVFCLLFTDYCYKFKTQTKRC